MWFEPRFSAPSSRRRAFSFATLLVGLALSSPASAVQFGPLTPSTKPVTSGVGAAATSTAEEKAAPDSPRVAMGEFTEFTRSGDYEKAARYLDLSAVDQSDGPILAKRLRDVLDRHLFIDVEKLSPNSHGNTEDGSPADRAELGSVPGSAGKPEPVVIVRRVERGDQACLLRGGQRRGRGARHRVDTTVG